MPCGYGKYFVMFVKFEHESFVILRHCQYTGAAQTDALFVNGGLRALNSQIRVLPMWHHSGTWISQIFVIIRRQMENRNRSLPQFATNVTATTSDTTVETPNENDHDILKKIAQQMKRTSVDIEKKAAFRRCRLECCYISWSRSCHKASISQR